MTLEHRRDMRYICNDKRGLVSVHGRYDGYVWDNNRRLVK